jgi:hypothetical protein
MSRNSLSLGRDLNPGTEEYEAGELTTRLQRSYLVSETNLEELRLMYDTRWVCQLKPHYVAILVGPCIWSNVVGEWLAFLLCIQEVPDSNLSPQTRYSDNLFTVFLCPSQKIPGNYIKLDHAFFLKIFSNCSSNHLKTLIWNLNF